MLPYTAPHLAVAMRGVFTHHVVLGILPNREQNNKFHQAFKTTNPSSGYPLMISNDTSIIPDTPIMLGTANSFAVKLLMCCSLCCSPKRIPEDGQGTKAWKRHRINFRRSFNLVLRLTCHESPGESTRVHESPEIMGSTYPPLRGGGGPPATLNIFNGIFQRRPQHINACIPKLK